MGHFVAARQLGLDVGAPVFIPFVGAWVSLKTVDLSPETEAHIAIAGPILGSAAAFVCYLWASETRDPFWWALAYSGFFINLFNLIPLKPLDGGRIAGVLSPKMWLVGIPILMAAFAWKPSPLIFIIAIMAAPQILAQWRGTAPPQATVAPTVRNRYALAYSALVVALCVLALDVHEKMEGGENRRHRWEGPAAQWISPDIARADSARWESS